MVSFNLNTSTLPVVPSTIYDVLISRSSCVASVSSFFGVSSYVWSLSVMSVELLALMLLSFILILSLVV